MDLSQRPVSFERHVCVKSIHYLFREGILRQGPYIWKSVGGGPTGDSAHPIRWVASLSDLWPEDPLTNHQRFTPLANPLAPANFDFVAFPTGSGGFGMKKVLVSVVYGLVGLSALYQGLLGRSIQRRWAVA